MNLSDCCARSISRNTSQGSPGSGGDGCEPDTARPRGSNAPRVRYFDGGNGAFCAAFAALAVSGCQVLML
jgi:hypothetical protein